MYRLTGPNKNLVFQLNYKLDPNFYTLVFCSPTCDVSNLCLYGDAELPTFIRVY